MDKIEINRQLDDRANRRERKERNDDDDMDLGKCCNCSKDEDVRNILMLDLRAPIAGMGWGCFQCGLPLDGAVAVLCDDCMKQLDGGYPLFVCAGYPKENERVSIQSLSSEKFSHDMSKHPEEQSGGLR
jgi:hypothetical protein